MTEPRRSIGARRNPETEAAILNAASAILAEKGFDGLTMEAVARRARAGKATLYRWWPTRGTLLMAAYHRQKPFDSYPDTGTLQGDVTAVLRLLFDHWQRPEGQMFRHIIAAAQADSDVLEALQVYREERLDALEEVFQRAVHRGELKKDVPLRDMGRALMGLAWLHLLTGQFDSDTGPMARSLLHAWVQ